MAMVTPALLAQAGGSAGDNGGGLSSWVGAENYISGVIMGVRNPFSPGDEIVSGEFEGSVEEPNLIRVRCWHAPRIADMCRIRSTAIVAVVAALEHAGIELPFERMVIEIAAGAAGPPASPLGTD